jgi:hypothetical protein
MSADNLAFVLADGLGLTATYLPWMTTNLSSRCPGSASNTWATKGTGVNQARNELEAILSIEAAAAAAEGEMEVKGSDRYYIQSGVRRAVASQQRLLSEIPAVI